LAEITASDRAACGCQRCMMELSQIVFAHRVEEFGGFVQVPLAKLDAHLASGSAFMSAEVKTSTGDMFVRLYNTEEAVQEMLRQTHHG
jgi:hypothetical protein